MSELNYPTVQIDAKKKVGKERKKERKKRKIPPVKRNLIKNLSGPIA